MDKRFGWLLVAHDCLAESFAHHSLGNDLESRVAFNAYRWAIDKAGGVWSE